MDKFSLFRVQVDLNTIESVYHIGKGVFVDIPQSSSTGKVIKNNSKKIFPSIFFVCEIILVVL